MSIVKFVNEPYAESDCLENVIRYVADPAKCICYGSWNVVSDSEECWQMMNATKDYFGKNKDKRLIHIVVSSPKLNSMTPYSLYLCGKEISRHFADQYQVFFGVHRKSIRSNCQHIHIIINNVSFINGKKYHGEEGMFTVLRNHVACVLGEDVYDDYDLLE